MPLKAQTDVRGQANTVRASIEDFSLQNIIDKRSCVEIRNPLREIVKHEIEDK